MAEAASAINDEGGIVDALPALARVLERPNVSGEPLVRRTISANLRAGDAAGVARVAAYVRRAGVPEPLRVEAISVLGVWAAPSNMDRVDGAWIAPLPQRESAAAQAAVLELASLLTDATATSAVKIAWMEAAAEAGHEGPGRDDPGATANPIPTRLSASPRWARCRRSPCRSSKLACAPPWPMPTTRYASPP